LLAIVCAAFTFIFLFYAPVAAVDGDKWLDLISAGLGLGLLVTATMFPIYVVENSSYSNPMCRLYEIVMALGDLVYDGRGMDRNHDCQIVWLSVAGVLKSLQIQESR
jgi:hypothetical protein